jgi:YbbR domain-containing protein
MGKFLSGELAIKIISVVAAFVMWMYVMNEQNPQVTYVVRNVPVKLQNLDESKFALRNTNQQFFINVKVKGRRSLIADLKPQDIEAEVNLQGRMEGENLLPVSVTVPGNVELLDFSPKEIMVVLDAVIEEQMPVYADIKGVPAEGYAYTKPVVRPQAVVVKGPRTLVNSIKKVAVQVDISGKNATVVSTLPLRVLDAQDREQRGITFRPDVVEVTVPVVPVSSVPISPDIKGSPQEGYIVKDVRVAVPVVVLTGGRDVLRSIDTVFTEPINIEGLTQTVSRDVRLILPRGVKIFEEQVKTVRVTVEIEKLSSRTLTFRPEEIAVNNLSPEFTAELENRDIVLTVRGPESIIDRVNKNMVEIYVDILGLVEGEHMLKIRASIPRPYTIAEIQPESIKVTLRRI